MTPFLALAVRTRWIASFAEASSAFIVQFRSRLRDRRFWIVQAMVLAVTGSHTLVEGFHLFPHGSVDVIYFLPASLYLFPVLYASLNFGKEGAIPTAIWSAALSVPNILVWHEGLERLGEAFQLGTVVFLSIIVATRVDREVAARRDAEAKGRAHRISELKYRSLFDSAGQAIILFEESGAILDANAAAVALFGQHFHDVNGEPLVSVLQGQGACPFLSMCAENGSHAGRDFRFVSEQGEVWLEPICTSVPGSEGNLILAVFRDVTARRGFQSYAREIVRAQEDERQRIARDLHDVSLQAIVLLCRQLDTVEEAIGDEQVGDASAALLAARRVAEDIGGELRRFSRDLRPSVLDDLGLVPAIRTLVNELTARSKVGGRFLVTGVPSRLSPAAEVSLFRIAQESLRNVERHASASQVTVRLVFETDSVLLKIADNGKGFQTPSQTTRLAESGRLGILGMQERASLAGGACEVTSRPGHGTRVEVRLPTSAQDQANGSQTEACPPVQSVR
jgi:PAS domain S-box-containing protein